MGTVFLPIPVVRSWESYTSKIVNDAGKVFAWTVKQTCNMYQACSMCRKLRTACVDTARLDVLT